MNNSVVRLDILAFQQVNKKDMMNRVIDLLGTEMKLK